MKYLKIGIMLAYCAPNKFFRTVAIDFVKKLSMLEEILLSSCLAFTQIHKLHNYGQFKLHRGIITMPPNIDYIQSSLQHSHKDRTTIRKLLKCK